MMLDFYEDEDLDYFRRNERENQRLLANFLDVKGMQSQRLNSNKFQGEQQQMQQYF